MVKKQKPKTRERLYRYGGMVVRVVELREEPGVEQIQIVRRRPYGAGTRMFAATRGTLKGLMPLPERYRLRLRAAAEREDRKAAEKARRERLAARGIELPNDPYTDFRQPVPSGAA